MAQLNLKGTEKQIAWATDLINDAMNTIVANLENAKNSKDFYAKYNVQAFSELKASLEKVIAKLETAAQVIDNRSILNPSQILHKANMRANQLRELDLRAEREEQAETTETNPETTETKTETPEAKTETKSETPAKAGKKIIINGKEVSISEALRSKLFYRALDHDLVGIIEDDAREAAHKAADDKCDVDDLFNGYGGAWHEAFLSAYLEAAENDLVIDTAEIERQEAAIAEREEAEALARIDMLP